MKNITLQNFLDDLASDKKGINWPDILNLSRMDAGLSTARASATCYAANIDKKENDRKIIDKLHERGYVTYESPSEIRALLPSKNENCIACLVTINKIMLSGDSVGIVALGDSYESQEMVKWFKEEFNRRGSLIITASHIDGTRGLVLDRNFIPEDTVQVARQSFYPWLGIDLADYYQKFMDSEESVLVMYGPPGTGKTTFLRSLIAHGNYNAFLAYNKEVIESPQLLRSYYHNSKARILAYEDIDKHLAKREDDNTLMASLLNAADGVIKHVGKKIVFVTNLPSTERIDQALMRKGRCFDIMDFKLLSPEEVVAVRKDMNLPPKDFGHTKSISLAEALAGENVRQEVNRFGRGMGFGS